MRKSLFAAVAGLAATAASATPPIMGPPPPAPPPRLLIVISVDQLSSDLFEEYRPMLMGGLGRMARGTVFRNGYQAHAATETCPGHSTVLTGAHPARNGIIANGWIDQSLARANKSVYCAEDVRIAPPEGATLRYTVSPAHLKVRTLGEMMKAGRPESRHVAVAGKDRAAVMMSGRIVDQRWFWDGRQFSTDLASAPVPASVTAANAAIAAALAASVEPLEPPSICAAKARPIPTQPGGPTVGAGRFGRAAGDARAFRASPELDGATLAVAAALINELGLGTDTTPDVLAIGLAATDYVGHSFGTNGSEMCLQMFALDRELGDFFAQLDRQGLDYAVALTSDHGGQDIPERLREQGMPDASRAEAILSATEMGKRLGRELGLQGPVLLGDVGGDVYVDRSLSAANRARALASAAAAYRAHPQVEAVLTREQLAAMPIPTGPVDRWSLAERARASFDAERSGDLVVLFRRMVTPIPRPSPGYVATHGTPWDHDRRVPIIFWRPGMAPADRPEAVATVDIMPTLAAMLGLGRIADPIDGKCLKGIVGIACPLR